MSLKLNFNEIESILKIKLDEKTKLLEEGLKSSLDSAVFSWGSVTHRKNGEIVSDPRNAIDTGNLQQSIKSSEMKGLKTKILFDAEYSALVMEHSTVDFVEFTIDRLS